MQTMTLKRWNVAELTHYVRQLMETNYRLQDVEVTGEVSNFRVPGSGHAYFTLKDAKAQLQCVMWASEVSQLVVRPKDGDQIIARGHISIYEKAGQYQLYCRSLMPAGEGDLYVRFEALKNKLEAEGLFDPTNKRVIPEQPAVIGVVTSPDAAALQDALNVIRRRYPLARVVVSPTLVQGEQAAAQIVTALEALNQHPDVDVILIVRGGGSLEDLWCFNNERVVRAVANSRLPTISGVGHETDFTLTDFAADVRAPTPSSAAELATYITRDDLLRHIQELKNMTGKIAYTAIAEARQQLATLTYQLGTQSPGTKINNMRQHVDQFTIRLGQAISNRISNQRVRLDAAQRALHNVSPSNTLARGYAIVYDEDGQIVQKTKQTTIGRPLRIHLYKGSLGVRVEKVQEND